MSDKETLKCDYDHNKNVWTRKTVNVIHMDIAGIVIKLLGDELCIANKK